MSIRRHGPEAGIGGVRKEAKAQSPTISSFGLVKPRGPYLLGITTYENLIALNQTPDKQSGRPAP